MGGGGKGKSPTMTADNLFNQDTVELGMAIAEGTIRGLTNGLKTMYVGGTPVESETGELNFQDLGISIKQGYFDDQPIRYMMGGEASVLASANSITLPANITRNFTTPSTFRGSLSFIDIRLLVQMLYSGDSGGNVYSSSILLEIKYRKTGSTDWNYVLKGSQELINYRKKVNTLKQEAINRGLNFDTMTEQQQFEFELSVLKTMNNITNADIEAFNDGMVDYYTSRIITVVGMGGSGTSSLRPTVSNSYSYRLMEPQSVLADFQKQDPDLTLEELQHKFMVIEGKTTSGYIQEICIPIFDDPNDTHDWEIQITRKSRELTSDEKKFSGREVSVESIALISGQEKSYSKIATCQVVAQHTDRFNQIPDFSGEFDGFLCEVPTNYNPDNHSWSGVWDGRFKRAWTNNNALILREIIMNRDWGKRSVEPLILMDNTSLFEAIKWCDELVKDLDGNMVPRYTFNMVVQEQQNLDDFIDLVAGTFHASVREVFGVNYIFIDRPQTPKFFVCPETILQTDFHFSMADLQTQYNEIKVSFANAANNYTEDRRRVIDEPSIVKKGYIPYSFQAIGVTNVTEALRQAAYMLYTNRDENIYSTFSQPRLGHLVNLYDHFLLASKKNGWGNSARILSYDFLKGLIHLRDPILELASTEKYVVTYHRPSGLQNILVTTVDSLTLKVQGTELEYLDHRYLMENTPIIIAGGNYGSPRTFRVLEMEQSDSSDVAQGELYTFKTCNVSTEKYAKLDNIWDTANLDLGLEKDLVVYKREKFPTRPKDIMIYGMDKSNDLGQLTYKLSFEASIEAPEYEVIWVNESTRETRKAYIQSTESLLSPAFPYDTAISLRITPINYAGVRMDSVFMQKVRVGSYMQSQMPNLLSMTYDDAAGGVIFTWANDAVDIFNYSHILVDYRNPSNTQLDIRLEKNARSFTVPFGGSGDYLMNIRYVVTSVEGQGYEGEIPSNTWAYTLEVEQISNQLGIPTNLQLNMTKTLVVQSGANAAELIAAPIGYGFMSSFSFNIPDRETNPEVAGNSQPFKLEYTESSNPNGAVWTELTYSENNPTLQSNVKVMAGNSKIVINKSDLTVNQYFKLSGWFRLKARYVSGGVDSVKDSDSVLIQIPTNIPSESLFNPEDIYNQQLT